MRRVGIFSVVSALTCVLTAAIGLASANATENKAEWAVNEGAGLVKLTKAEGLSEAITTKTKLGYQADDWNRYHRRMQ
jgi:tagatose-1,6-bisphosphate aldolase non-catalytic subunit AgaZ/GatZ